MRRFTVLRCSYKNAFLGRRALHYPPPLRTRVEQGLANFLPPPALKVVAVDYQQGLLQRLNEEVKDTELDGLSVVDTIIRSAPERSNVLAFNYASLALNNHFFIDQLAPPPHNAPSHQHFITPDFLSQIRLQHGSLAQLKSAFSAAAMGMFTNGYVWFVTDSSGRTAIIPTFGPGTLLVRSRTYLGHSKELLMGESMLQYDRGDPLTNGDPYEAEWKEELAEMVTGKRVSAQEVVDYEAEAERDASTSIPAPTPKSSPPGVSPSSPASGVSGTGSGSGNPANPLHPRFLHSSSPSLNNNNYTPTSLFADPTTSSSSVSPSLSSRLLPNNSALPPKYYKTKPRTDHYTLTMEETLYPLFCVSVHEHAWMSAGYGVWGKERWLKEFWSVLDWKKVCERYEYYTPEIVRMDQEEDRLALGL